LTIAAAIAASARATARSGRSLTARRVAPRRQPVQREAEILALVADVDRRVPAALRLLFLHHRGRHRRLRPRDGQIRPIADGAPRRACEVERQRRERQLSFQCEQSIGRHASKQLQLERRDLDTALRELSARVQAVHLHELQALVEGRRGPLAHPCPYDLECAAVHAQELVGDLEVPLGRQQLARLHAHLRTHLPLALGDLTAPRLDFPLRHPDAPFLPPIQIERERYPDVQVVVGAQRLLASELEHGVGPQARLLQPPRRSVDLEPRRLEIGVVGERASHQLVHGHLAACLCPRGHRHDRGESDQKEC